MNMKKKLPMTNIGITTIITVFIVLSLVTFAALSFVNAKNDKSLSEQVATHNNDYYEAANQANIQISSIAKMLQSAYNDSNIDSLRNIKDEYLFEYPVGDSHILYVTLVPTITATTDLSGQTPILYLENQQLNPYSITRFEVVTTNEWNTDDQYLPLQTFGN